jgi:hypothetical protein
MCSSQRRLPDNTQHTQQKIIHAPGGIRIHNLNRWAVADLRLRPLGIWDRHLQRIKMLQLSFRTTTHVEINSGFGEIILYFIIRYLLVIFRSSVLMWDIFLFWTGECNTIIESHFHPCISVKLVISHLISNPLAHTVALHGYSEVTGSLNVHVMNLNLSWRTVVENKEWYFLETTFCWQRSRLQ